MTPLTDQLHIMVEEGSISMEPPNIAVKNCIGSHIRSRI